jgi:hypothetical protein
MITLVSLVYSIHLPSLLSAVFRYIAKAPLRDGYKGGSSRALLSIPSLIHLPSLLSAVFRYIAKAPLRDGYKGGSSRAPIYEGSVNDDVPLLGASTYTKIDSDGADSSGMHAPINQRTFLKYFNIGHNLTELFHKSEQRSEYDKFCCCINLLCNQRCA